jgi:hypothetical protein
MSYLRYLCLSLPPLVCRRGHVLFTLFVFVSVYSCVQPILCCVFVLFFFVLRTLFCQFLRTVSGGHIYGWAYIWDWALIWDWT